MKRMVLGAALFAIALSEAACDRLSRRTYALRDTEGRTFSGTCDTERWGDCTFASAATPATRPPGTPGRAVFTVRPWNRFAVVCDAWQSASGSVESPSEGSCRLLACASDGDCPSWARKSPPSRCLGGLCVNDPPGPLTDGDVRLLCLAGTGAPATPPTRLQEDRWALASGACPAEEHCRVPVECRQPVGLPPPPPDRRARTDAGLPPMRPLREARRVASLDDDPVKNGLALDGDALFAAEHWRGLGGHHVRILRLSVAGGDRQLLATVDDASDLVAGAGRIAWVASSGIATLAAGGTPREAKVEWAHGLLLDGDAAFTCNAEGLVRVALATGRATPIAPLEGAGAFPGCQLADDAGAIYVAYDLAAPIGNRDAATRARIVRVAKRGGGVTRLLDAPSLGGIAVDGDRLFYTTVGTTRLVRPGNEWLRPEVRPNPDGSVRSCPTAGGPSQLVAAGELAPGSLVLDEKYVYFWAAHGVRRAPRSGGPAELLAATDTIAPTPTRGAEQRLVASAKAIYWSNSDGDVFSVEK